VILKAMAMMRNFGHSSFTEFDGVGINGKNSEVHAAMGLTNISHISEILSRRKSIYQCYVEKLNGLPIRFQKIAAQTSYNYAYFPIIFENEETLLSVVDTLNLNNVYPRRYFYPCLTKLPYVSNQSAPIAEDVAQRILCLPVFHSLSREEIDMICRLIKRAIRY
jgi:dTDP-4-amino-4,6-dideoxygalactose transaminase